MKKTLVIVSSLSGNTWKVGEQIAKHYPQCDLLRTDTVAKNPSLIQQYSNIIIGFWCDKKGLPPDLEPLLNHVHDKKIGIFSTMGGYPESEKSLQWFAQQCNTIIGVGRNNQLKATFLCRGRITPMYLKNSHHNTPEGIAQYESSQEHPNDEDLKNAVEAFATFFA